MSSFKELYDNYENYKEMTEEELTELIGPWWAHLFFETKDDIKKVRDNYEKSIGKLKKNK